MTKKATKETAKQMTTINSFLPHNTVEQMLIDKVIRTEIAKESHYIFFHFYFPHYVQYLTAPFQREIFEITEDESIKNFACCAFRGSGKSTIITMSYPIWAILGKQQKKFVLIVCQTQHQAKQHMINLKRELESNTLLKNDLGPFHEESDEWGVSSLVFSNTGARITAVSSEQSIRGLRHRHHRPDLIICDDVENLASTKTREGRQKTYEWLTGEVIPAGDKNTRLIIIGNLLHEDSLLMRIRRKMKEGSIEGVYREYPLLDKDDNILWPGKYPSMKDIEIERKKIGNNVSYQREYLLHIIPTEEQVVHRDWIQTYDKLPAAGEIHGVIIGIDLAISKKETADCTAMVTAVIHGYDDNFHAYILPHPINDRLDFPETVSQMKILINAAETSYEYPKAVIESVGYQGAIVDQMKHDGYKVEGIPVSSDKHSRLMSVSNLIQNGVILFPEEGAEQIIEQIVNFGVERHDDLVDAFTLMAHQVIQEDHEEIADMVWLDW